MAGTTWAKRQKEKARREKKEEKVRALTGRGRHLLLMAATRSLNRRDVLLAPTRNLNRQRSSGRLRWNQ